LHRNLLTNYTIFNSVKGYHFSRTVQNFYENICIATVSKFRKIASIPCTVQVEKTQCATHVTRGQILEHNWDKSSEFSSVLFTDTSTGFYCPPLLSKSGLNMVNHVYGKLKSENHQNYAQKPQQNQVFGF
jgi:hypothetical protein